MGEHWAQPSEFSTPVLGLIFLRYAEKRFAEAEAKLLKAGVKPDEIEKSDFQADGVLYLPEKARFTYLLKLPGSENLGKAINDAMASIEEENEDLKGVLPRAYTRLDNRILVELLRLLAPVDLEGDAFGKIYEYFLGAFAMKEGQKGGVFYTPTSIVNLSSKSSNHSTAASSILPAARAACSCRVRAFVENHKKRPIDEISVFGHGESQRNSEASPR